VFRAALYAASGDIASLSTGTVQHTLAGALAVLLVGVLGIYTWLVVFTATDTQNFNVRGHPRPPTRKEKLGLIGLLTAFTTLPVFGIVLGIQLLGSFEELFDNHTQHDGLLGSIQSVVSAEPMLTALSLLIAILSCANVYLRPSGGRPKRGLLSTSWALMVIVAVLFFYGLWHWSV